MSDSATPATRVIVTGRLSYADIFKPRAFEEGKEERFKTLILLDKKDPNTAPQMAAIKKAADAAKKEKWGDKVPALTADRVCVRDGDTTGKEDQVGFFVISASETTAPQVLDRDGKTVLKESDGKIYSGCHARVILNLWCQDNKYGKRVNANLLAVQFVKHDKAFGKARINASEVFGALDDSELGDMEGFEMSESTEDENAGLI